MKNNSILQAQKVIQQLKNNKNTNGIVIERLEELTSVYLSRAKKVLKAERVGIYRLFVDEFNYQLEKEKII